MLAVSLWVLYDRVVNGERLKNISYNDIDLLSLISHPLFWLVVLLMPLNWGLEALKWRMLVGRFEKETYYVAIKSVFTGVFISLFVNILVPNRMGEFAGRIIYVKLNKVKASLISFIGSFAQFVVTVLCGAVGYLVFWYSFYDAKWQTFTEYLLVITAGFVIALLVLLYFNINVLSWMLSRPRILRRFKKITSVFYFYKSALLAEVLGISILRYTVFCGQFIALLMLCGIDISITQGLTVIPVIFLVQTIVPSNALSDLGVRGAASIFFLNYYTVDDTAILAATYLLWGINILIPGLIGALFFAVFKYRNGNGNGAND